MERVGWKYWTRFMMKRKRANIGGYKLKNRFIRMFLKKSWNKRRKPLQITKKSFNQYWIEGKLDKLN